MFHSVHHIVKDVAFMCKSLNKFKASFTLYIVDHFYTLLICRLPNRLKRTL